MRRDDLSELDDSALSEAYACATALYREGSEQLRLLACERLRRLFAELCPGAEVIWFATQKYENGCFLEINSIFNAAGEALAPRQAFLDESDEINQLVADLSSLRAVHPCGLRLTSGEFFDEKPSLDRGTTPSL